MMNSNASISWDLSTGYDLFVSIWSLYSPLSFGLRPRWASGMRARLPNRHRETLEQMESLVFDKRPSHWVYSVPLPKDGQAVINALADLPPAERLPTLALRLDRDQAVNEYLREIADRGEWDQEDYAYLREHFQWYYGGRPSDSALVDMLNLWADAEAFGERYLKALEVYYQVYYAEEERRIRPALEEGLARAQVLAAEMSLADLLDHFAANTNWRAPEDSSEWVFAPSYWVIPWLFTTKISPTKRILLFAAREEGDRLPPGQNAPEELVASLKAIADPTRLRILQYLAAEALTPTLLAGRLNLRTSTVAHHLRVLWEAGLVNPGVKTGLEKSYTARTEALPKVFTWAQRFVQKSQKKPA